MLNNLPMERNTCRSLSPRDLLKPRSLLRVSTAAGVNRCRLFVSGAEGTDLLCLPPSLYDARCLKRVQAVPVPGRVAAELSSGSPGCCWKWTISSQLREREKKVQHPPPPSSCSAAGAVELSLYVPAGKKLSRSNGLSHVLPTARGGCPPPLAQGPTCRGWPRVAAAPVGGGRGCRAGSAALGRFPLLSGSPPPSSFASSAPLSSQPGPATGTALTGVTGGATCGGCGAGQAFPLGWLPARPFSQRGLYRDWVCRWQEKGPRPTLYTCIVTSGLPPCPATGVRMRPLVLALFAPDCDLCGQPCA